MWEHLIEGETRDGFGFVLKGNINDLGHRAINTPGSLKAYGEAISQYGTWDWADIVAPAIAQADEGFKSIIGFLWVNGADHVDEFRLTNGLAFSSIGKRSYFNSSGNLKR